MFIKIILIVLCGILWRLGGWGKESGNPLPWRGWRMVLIPIILGINVGLYIKDYWYIRLALGLATIASLNIIRIGYGNYDPEHDNKPSFLARITHDRNGWWIRAIAGALYILVGYLPHTLYSHRWSIYFICAIISSLVGYCVSRFRLKDIIADPLIGVTLASIILKI